MKILAKDGASTNAMPARDFPVIEGGNDSFPDGNYMIDTEADGSHPSRFIMRHAVEGARLVERLLTEKKAVFACAIAAPRSAYREILRSCDATHKIEWDPKNFGEPPYFTPMILCVEDVRCVLDSGKDQVHPAWDGVEAAFPKGAWLALGPVLQLKSSGMESLISIRPDDALGPGRFRTDVVAGDAFRFEVRCNPELHALLQGKKGRRTQRADVMIHVVTSCFAALQREYPPEDEGEEGWRAYKSLETLAGRLADENYCDWSDTEFRPEEAATLLYPHEMALPTKEEDD